MRIQVGELPSSATSDPRLEGWTRITAPWSLARHILSWAIGVAILLSLLVLMIAGPMLRPSAGGALPDNRPTPWIAILLTLILAVPLHEFLHAVLHPGGPFTDSTVFTAWPSKLRFGVYFEGVMSRRRWLVMRLAPLAALGVLPALLLTTFAGGGLSPAWEASLSVMLLVNTLGSGSDVLGAAWVAANIPRGSKLAFTGGRAYWKAGA